MTELTSISTKRRVQGHEDRRKVGDGFHPGFRGVALPESRALESARWAATAWEDEIARRSRFAADANVVDIPNCSFAASDIMLRSHTGSKTTSTSACFHAGERFDFRFHVRGEDRAHAAAGGGEGHLDLDVLRAVGVFELAEVDEAEVDDVDGDLGVVAGLELVPDQLFELLGVDVFAGRELGADVLDGVLPIASTSLPEMRTISPRSVMSV